MNPKVRATLSFVEDNLHRRTYVGEAAQLVRLSRSRFTDLFKSEVGMSLTQYLKKTRIKKARQLLETTFEPVKAIAVEVGYNDPTRFEREFKKSCGLTPSQYRDKYLGTRLGKDKFREENRRIG